MPSRGAAHNHPLRSIWEGMIARCYQRGSTSYYLYGARGITVCQRWRRFWNFVADMGTRTTLEHSLDRIDVNGNYGPGNCRWATAKEQQRNLRVNVRITAFGECLVQSAWAERFGIDGRTIGQRPRAGWSPERAVSQKSRKKHRKNQAQRSA